MNKQAIIKCRQDCINNVKDVCGKNCEYFSPDKCIYYSPNRTFRKQLKHKVVENNIPDLFLCMKKFKSEHADEQVKIVKV
jgi:hypothetical protein